MLLGVVQKYQSLCVSYMSFIHRFKVAGLPNTSSLDKLHEYIDKCSQLLDNHDPMIIPPFHAHVSISVPSDINNDDDIATLSAFPGGNMGCSNEVLCRFEVFAGQQQQGSPL